MEVKEMKALLSEQRRELAAAEAVEINYNAAYRLQMQEAIIASISEFSYSADFFPDNHNIDDDDDDDDEPMISYQLFSQEISDYELRLSDHETAKKESKRIENDINRENHDHAFALEILKVPEDEWMNTGDFLQKPYFDNGSSSTSMENLVSLNIKDCYRVHVKGLLCQVKGSDEGKDLVAGIGVAICNRKDELILEVSKEVVGTEDLIYEIVELKALVESLRVINNLGLKKVTFACCNNFLYQCVTGKWHPPEASSSSSTVSLPTTLLLKEVNNLQRKLTHCNVALVGEMNLKSAYELAKKAIASQLSIGTVEVKDQTIIINGGKSTEICGICLENVNVEQMFTIHPCRHRYCFVCMNKHVEHKLQDFGASSSVLPTCPQVGCKTTLELSDSRKFLTDELFRVMVQRVKEFSIPPSDKIYCPIPTCSKLMSKSKLLSKSASTSNGGGTRLPMTVCKRCCGMFCINCNVPWHNGLSCKMYKRSYRHPSPCESSVMALASNKSWRQCRNCKNMVSLSSGCNHIYCRCGHEFCYICGAEWKDKKQTCRCNLWDEKKIIYN